MNGHLYSLAHDHWKEFLPSLYRKHVKNETLKKALTKAVDRTEREMQSAMDGGMNRDQAWELVRSRYLLMTPETDNDSEYDENPNKPFLDLMDEIRGETQAIYDDL